MAKVNINELTREQVEKAMSCKTAEELMALAKAQGIELTKEEANAYLDELSECELKDGDLKHIAGGKIVAVGNCSERPSFYIESY
jgi:hypothetical protein